MDSPHPLQPVFEAYVAAVWAKDVDAFVALYDEDVRVFDLWAPWSYEGLAAWRAMASGWFGSLGSERVRVAFDEVKVDVASDLATAQAVVRYAAVSTDGEEQRRMANRLTWVLRRRGDAWKIVHAHTSAPLDGPTMKVSFSR